MAMVFETRRCNMLISGPLIIIMIIIITNLFIVGKKRRSK